MSRSDTDHRVQLLVDQPPDTLLIHELYRSLQGESTYAGLPCTFVRLAVCNSRCVWCDTPHAFNRGERYSIEAVLAEVERLGTRLVEVTGGEPLLQPAVHPLLTALCDRGYTVLLETSGALPIADVDSRVRVIMDLKCPDSGEEPGNHWPNLDQLKPVDEVKFVIASEGDFRWAAEVVRQHQLTERGPVIVSPVFDRVTPADLSAWVLASGLPVRMQLQLHKLIWEPTTRGV